MFIYFSSCHIAYYNIFGFLMSVPIHGNSKKVTIFRVSLQKLKILLHLTNGEYLSLNVPIIATFRVQTTNFNFSLCTTHALLQNSHSIILLSWLQAVGPQPNVHKCPCKRGSLSHFIVQTGIDSMFRFHTLIPYFSVSACFWFIVAAIISSII